MQPSEQPALELKKARLAIEAMRHAKNLDEFEESWKEFLGRLERVWSKGTNHFGKSPKWSGWKAKFEPLRRSDSLLSYLVNARGAEEHTVNKVIAREPGSRVNIEEGGSIYIEPILCNNLNIALPMPVMTVLLPVTNRGRKYLVPTLHLGNPVDPNNVIGIAEMGAQFYERFLEQAEEFFVK